MVFILAILLYTHPTLSDNPLMWILLVVSFGAKLYQLNRLNNVIKWIATRT